MTTDNEARSLPLADVHVFHDGLKLRLVHDGAYFGIRIEAITEFQLTRAFREEIQELAVDFRVHRNSARGGAALPGRAESAPHRSLNSQLEVGIVHDHHNVLATHF